MDIKLLYQTVGEEVTVKGWLANKRVSKNLYFLIVRDGTGFAQCVVNYDEVGEEVFERAKELTQESSLIITGNVIKDENQIGGYEIRATNLEIIHVAEEYPITNKPHGVDFLMDNRHLWLRSFRQWAIMRVRNRIIYAIHTFLQEEGFIQMDAPIFTGNAVEGTTTLFQTDFFDNPAYLTQSGQLYGEAMAMAQKKIYTFGPTFRAEKSKTRRHLAEFWMIEPEMAFFNNDDNMDLIERFLKYIIKDVLENSEYELSVLERDTSLFKEIVEKEFPRVSYTRAGRILNGEEKVNGRTTIEMLNEEMNSVRSDIESLEKEIEENEKKLNDSGLKKGKRNFLQSKVDSQKNKLRNLKKYEENLPSWLESAKNFQYGDDFGGSDETVLTRMFMTPIMIYNWPQDTKAFYMKKDEDNPELAKGVDVLAPEGFGEIVGGGERETDLNWLIEKINEHNLPMEAFKWYLDIRRYGAVPHSGFGLGLERFVAWICNLEHVRETIPFPRMYGRLTP